MSPIQYRSVWTSFFVCALMFFNTQLFATGTAPTGYNQISDPNALYGFCTPNGSALGTKTSHVAFLGESLVDVLAITVLDCGPFSGGAPEKITCPANSPYAFCTNTGNDGLGNNVTLGVLKFDAKTDPNGLYTNCPSGAQLKSKLSLIGGERRWIKGIVTLACESSHVGSKTKPERVACPDGPNPYDFCVSTANDGFGNAVTIGVVKAKDAGDPYGMYGQCHTNISSFGIKPGFMPKASLVTSVGLSMETVRSIDIIVCNQPGGIGSWLPDNLVTGSCSEILAGIIPGVNRYNYCIWGTDKKGNGLIAGVNQ